MITAKTKICMVIGDPVEDSSSPIIHNAGYRALNLDDEFVYVASKVNVNNIAEFAMSMKILGVKGASLKLPHKEKIQPYLDRIDPIAEEIGAVNTIVNDGGRLTGYNTDYIGAINVLKEQKELKGANVSILGAGGAGKAFIYGLTSSGCNVTIYNRTVSKAKYMAEKFGCNFSAFDDQSQIKEADIICNTTSVGMNTNESPVDGKLLHSGQIVFDAVYSPFETKLLKDAKSNGAKIIHGTELLVELGSAQFKLFTGHDGPKQAMREALMEYLKNAR